jgi:hypothetical protein
MFPKFQVPTAYFSCSPPDLSSLKFTPPPPLLWRPLNYLLNISNYNFNIHRQENKNSDVSVIKLSLFITLTSSILFYPCQKDERALSGNLLIYDALSPQEIKCLSLLPQHFLFASTLLLSFRTLSLRLQRVKQKYTAKKCTMG